MNNHRRVVITGIGLTSPNGNTLAEYRANLLKGVSGVVWFETRYMGKVLAGVCTYDPLKYQMKKEVRRGTRAGSISIYCCQEAPADASLDVPALDKSRIGVYLGVTEHGNVETENEIYNLSQFNYDTKFWSHHHNPRTVANSPAGEVTLNMGITGPHYTIGAACAAGNAGLIQGVQMLLLDEEDAPLGGGASEIIHTVSIVSTHATATPLGDIQECQALRTVFADCPKTHFNNTKSFIGHAMGAAGALELAGNLPAFDDGLVHPTINVDHLDPQCEIPNLVLNTPKKLPRVNYILNNSSGMLGINSVVIVKRT